LLTGLQVMTDVGVNDLCSSLLDEI
ncbi:hypothetical protein LCGC14_2857190, partial [marine sediment metagenome]